MLAARAMSLDADDPLSGLEIGAIDAPAVPDGWVRVDVRAASINHHDVWTLRGVGISADRLPMTLGCDASGIGPDGREVVVHGVIGDPDAGSGDETLDPRRTLLSEVHQGTFAEQVVVPARNLLPKPSALSFEEAACLPVTWLTAYRMLATRSGLRPGGTVLVQGSAGGVASAAIPLARAMGLRVWSTARDDRKAEFARSLGAHAVFAPGDRLPHRVDAVLETVGEATWSHSLRSLRPGGRIVVSGATTGAMPPADLGRIFFQQLEVVGSTMGTLDEHRSLLSLLETTGLRPSIDRSLPLDRARDGLQAVIDGDLLGKVVLTVG